MIKIPNLLLATIILSISNIIVRGLGFIYKIFLSNVIGEQGLGIYHIVFNFLMICVALTTTGIPTALSCFISTTNTLKNKKGTNTYFISTLYIAFFIAFFISVFVSLNSHFLAQKFLHNSNLNLFILAVCPAVVLITISNVLRSYFYGIKKVVVPAIGQVLEQISRILFLVLVFYYIKNEGIICYSALLAISIGETVNIIFITINLYKDSNIYNKYTINMKDFKKASTETLKRSVPITCNRMTSIILQSISSIIIPSRLLLANMTYSEALGAYGIISGMVMPFVYLPFSVGSALFLAPIFLSLNQTLSAILHGIKKELISSFNNILGAVIQLIFLYFLLPIPSLNIYAYIYVVTAIAVFTTLLHTISLITSLKKLNSVN